jgi:VanZ family protein
MAEAMSTVATARQAPSGLIHSTRLHLILTALLVVGMPFLMLRAFLQEAIGRVSRAMLQLGGLEIPWVLLAVVAVGIPAVLLLRPYVNRGRLVAAVIGLLMIAYAQYINDYYYGHRFYELQMNWHYFAYMFVAIMFYRDLAPRGYAPATVILVTYFAALLFSTFDEAFQAFINNRVFDLGDISKDAWGSLIGMLIVYSGSGELTSRLPIRQRHLRDYLRNPRSVLILLCVFGFFLLTYSSLLNSGLALPTLGSIQEAGLSLPVRTVLLNTLRATAWVGCLALASFAAVFALLHLSQFRPVAWVLLAVAVLAVGVQVWACAKYWDRGIVYWRPGLAVYRGFVWPYFDFVILPNGVLHPATKLHDFNPRDRAFFLHQCADIILIGAGPLGEGGNGFMSKKPHFMYNEDLKRGSQIIILPTDQACRAFNRLKKEGKNVLFVVNND